MSRLARWRKGYWRLLFHHYGKDSKTCRNVRSVLLGNGMILAIGGAVVSFGMFFCDPLPHVPPPTLLERIGYGSFTLLIMTGGGLLSIYFGRGFVSAEK